MDKKLGCRMSIVNQLSLMENCVSTDAVVKEFLWLTGYQLSNVLYFDEFDRKSFSERQSDSQN